MAFIPQDGRLLTFSYRTGAVWNATTGTVERPLLQPSPVNAVAASPNGRLIATGSADGMIRLFDTVDFKLNNEFKAHSEEITGLAFTHNGARLVSASLDDRVAIWATATAEKIDEFTGEEQGVLTLAVSPDGRDIAWSSYGGVLRLWTPPAAKPRIVMQMNKGGRHPANVRFYQIAFSPDGRHLATANVDGTVFILRTASPSSPAQSESSDSVPDTTGVENEEERNNEKE